MLLNIVLPYQKVTLQFLAQELKLNEEGKDEKGMRGVRLEFYTMGRIFFHVSRSFIFFNEQIISSWLPIASGAACFYLICLNH